MTTHTEEKTGEIAENAEKLFPKRSLRSLRTLRFFPVVVLFLSAACGNKPPSGAVTAAPAPMVTSVGPVPGPSGNSNGSAYVDKGAANPYTNDRTATAEGRQLFIRFNCSGCHGGRAGGGMGPSLRDVDWLYGDRDAQVFSTIAEGRAHGMPSWQPRLTPDQIWKLVTYIKSLRTRNEPDPPPVQ
jgi:cbb3-type cytochrome c oxidase subunit III